MSTALAQDIKNAFRNETEVCKMKVCNKVSAERSWMSVQHGEGEEEVGNHGRSGAKSFSQETEAQGQRSRPRMGLRRPTLKRLKCRMHAETLTRLPFFYSSSRLVTNKPAFFVAGDINV